MSTEEDHRISPDAAENAASAPAKNAAAPTAVVSQDIDGAMLKTIENEDFLPYDVIARLTTRERIAATLDHAGIRYEDALLDYASDKGRRVFLILVSIEKLGALEPLFAGGFEDVHLPVSTKINNAAANDVAFYDIYSYNEAYDDLQPRLHAAFKKLGWVNRTFKKFVDQQWPFLAPIFDTKLFSYSLHSNLPIPIVSQDQGPGKRGFFSTVRKVRLHDSHQQALILDDGSKPQLALKKLLLQDSAYYRGETNALELVRSLGNKHLIRPVAAYRQREHAYFLFPWADGGNLREFWTSTDPRLAARDQDTVLWALEQMHGLVTGLAALHQHNVRHGDLKPENILLVLEPGQARGVLQIADVGLSRIHNKNTYERKGATTTMPGAIRYSPPEPPKKSDEPRSRAYDIWSLGCIFAEFMVWLVDGRAELEALYMSTRLQPFWERKDGEYRVLRAVDNKITHYSTRLQSNDAQRNALHDVLTLLNTQLLTVQENERAKVDELEHIFRGIYQRAKTEQGYLRTASISSHGRTGTTSSSLEVPVGMMGANQPNPIIILNPPSELETSSSVLVTPAVDQLEAAQVAKGVESTKLQAPAAANEEENQIAQMNEDWRSYSDNAFAQNLFGKIGRPQLRTKVPPAQLCSRCVAMDIWSPDCVRSDSLAVLETSSQFCKLCGLFYQAALQSKEPIDQPDTTVTFHRVASSFQTREMGLPVLSIYRDPEPGIGNDEVLRSSTQLGFPLLPDQGSETQLEVLREWLRTCDEQHSCMVSSGTIKETSLPTRVLFVGTAESPSLQLIDGWQHETGRYAALSHCWGQPNDGRKLRTRTCDLSKFRQGIDPDELPNTFRDAVEVTRAIGLSYLWIDSLCIIQDDDDDWAVESGRMEEVFSSAYCTLAASSGRSSDSGLWQPRKERPCVRVEASSHDTLYVCPAIDNFQRDVEQGVLNQRGWVLQERALSRRMIHFTSTQIYWECGEGVHCETLSKLSNSKSSFLGDANFPQSALSYYRGRRITLYQHIYEQYSRLDFTFYWDRPVAIASLEKRLEHTFKTAASFGVFKSYLERGLLWQRPKEFPSALRRIEFKKGQYVPSWSWMAYRGPIQYVDIPFDGAYWSKDVETSFNMGTDSWYKKPSRSDEDIRSTDLRCIACGLWMDDADVIERLVLDDPDGSRDISNFKGVVMGEERKSATPGAAVHWVLLIRPILPKKSYLLYERVGVASLLARHLDFQDTVSVRIR